jgi:hypothetical protein
VVFREDQVTLKYLVAKDGQDQSKAKVKHQELQAPAAIRLMMKQQKRKHKKFITMH